MKRLIVATLSLALLAALAQAEETKPVRMTIAPGKVGEVCMPLGVGDRLAWSFESSHAVDFNVHHHVGKDVLLPVDHKALRRHAGEHVIDTRNDWCLMWTAPPGQRVTIEGSWSVVRAPAK